MRPWWGSRIGVIITGLGTVGVLLIGGLAFKARPAATQARPELSSPSPSATASAATSGHLALLASAVGTVSKAQAAANASLKTAQSDLTSLRTVAAAAREHLAAERTAHTTPPQNCGVVGSRRSLVAADLAQSHALAAGITALADSVLASLAKSQPVLVQAGTELAAAQKAGATRSELSAYSTALQAAPISRTAIGTTATANRTSAGTLDAQVGTLDKQAEFLLGLCYRQTRPR